jgi:guanyl-specific ribonuclease Sa
MDHSKLDPDLCKCSKQSLASLVASWSKRAQDRVQAVIASGKPVDMSAVKHEAQLVASMARGGPMAFAQQNAHYGHFCEECPYRRRTPMRSTLAVDPQAAAG